MIQLKEDIFWDNQKPLHEQQPEAQELFQNIIETTDRYINRDEYGRPLTVVWENDEYIVTQTTTYKHEGTHPMAWSPLTSNITFEKKGQNNE